jgi:hypothetical protein
MEFDLPGMKETEYANTDFLGVYKGIQRQSEEQKKDSSAQQAANPLAGGACALP